MFFILSKILDVLLAPLFWGFFAFIYCVFTKNKRWRSRIGVCAMFFLFICSNKIIVNQCMVWWEKAPKPLPTEVYDVAIVLGGLSNTTKTPKDRVYFEKGAGRITHPLSLYHQGKVKKILISGGAFHFGSQSRPEAQSLKAYLLKNRVLEKDIIVEDQSLNTRQNALYTREILKNYPHLKKQLLVTSAFHMRRAELCFNKVGLFPTSLSVDYYTGSNDITLYGLLIPDAYALFKCTKLIHEIFGNLVYWLIGYN